MQLSSERSQPNHASEFLRVLGVVLVLHMALGWLLLGSSNLRLPQHLAPITIEIGEAPQPVQRGLAQAVAAQTGQGGVQSAAAVKNTQVQSQAVVPSPVTTPSNTSKEAPSVAKPVEAPVTPAEPVATTSPSHSALAVPQGQTQDAKETIKTADFDLQAAYKENPKPPYPRAAFRVGAEGTVEVAVEVNPDGSVAAVRLVQSSGHESLDQSALETIKGWRFRSARKDGVLSKSVVRVPITFRLRAAR